MDDRQLKEQLQTAIDNRLSGLTGNPFLAQRIINAEKGEAPPMKKKISVSLIFVMAFMLLSLGVAAALVHSQIADRLYGSQNEAPKEVLDQIQTPDKTVQTDLCHLSLQELYYDGSDLHTILSIENPTNETLLYTMDGFFINGAAAYGSHLFSEGPGSMGTLLGGTVDGTLLPITSTHYERWEQVAKTDEADKFKGWEKIPKGKVTLRILVDVWQPLNDPKLVDYDDFEGYDVNDVFNYLVTDENGLCNLELFRPESARRNYSSRQSGGEIYDPVFQQLGWAKRIDTIEMTLDMDLDQIMVSRAIPEKNEYVINGLRIIFDSFELTHGGGTLEGRVFGTQKQIEAFLQKGLVLVDRKGDRELSRGLTWSNTVNPDQSIPFTILLSPISGNLPTQVYLAQPIAYNDQFVEDYPNYNPALEKPENIIGTWELDFSKAIEIHLNIIK